MYGVSEELPFASLIGEECNMIGLGQFQIQFHFSGDRKSLSVESNWKLRDADGNIVDRAMPHDQRTEYRIHRIIDQSVSSFEVDAPSSFQLEFENGYRLTVYDDKEQFECFSLHVDGKSHYI